MSFVVIDNEKHEVPETLIDYPEAIAIKYKHIPEWIFLYGDSDPYPFAEYVRKHNSGARALVVKVQNEES